MKNSLSSVLSIQEASEVLSVSTKTIRKLITQKQLPALKVLNRWRIESVDIKKYIQQQRDQQELKILNEEIIKLGTVKKKMDSRYQGIKGKGAVYMKGPSWYIQYKDIDGKWIRKCAGIKGTHNENEAIKYLLEKVDDVKSSSPSRPCRKDEVIKFKDFKHIFFKRYCERKSTSGTDNQNFQTHLLPYFGELYLHEITENHVEEFAEIKRTQVKGSTVNRHLSLLRCMFNYAKKWGYRIGENPVPKGRMFDEKIYERDRVLSFDEEKRLLSVMPNDSHIRDCMMIALNTGMRKGEILKLKWEHIDFRNHLIVLKPENTKAKRSRKIDINHTAMEVLKRRKRLNGSEFVITYHGKPIHSIRSAWSKYVSLAEIRDFTFHDLRRTFGTRLLEAGVNLVTISRLLGHGRIETTMTYLKPRIELGREAVSILDQLSEREQVYYQPLLPKEGKNLVNHPN